jgi:hypothetical protein
MDEDEVVEEIEVIVETDVQEAVGYLYEHGFYRESYHE